MPIDGVRYVPAFIDDSQERALFAAVDAELWPGDLKRRVQHHGYRYDNKARRLGPRSHLGPLPD